MTKMSSYAHSTVFSTEGKRHSELNLQSNFGMDIGERIAAELAADKDKTQVGLAAFIGMSKSGLNELIKGRSKSSTKLHRIADYLGVSVRWLETGKGPKEKADINVSRYDLVVGDENSESADVIPMLEARGSCGGGVINWDAEPRRPLVKEESWFKRYKVTPKDVVAVWADGDSNADFIVDGDIVIFNIRKTEPKSGRYFLIEHPDGLRIKRLRREIDGTWVLESGNVDKRRFPDERIGPEHADLLVIKGEFLYRQGG